MNRRYPSPLRYPGGKGKLANFVKLLLLENDLLGKEYVELYAGGGGVGLELLYEEYVTHIHVNDLNRGLYRLWRAMVDYPEKLCKRIFDTEVTMDEWKRQKAVQRAHGPAPMDLAFSTFFLNRTNRSGIIGGGVIGGKKQTGKWKLDARYNKENLILRIEKLARYRSRITVTGLDAAEYLGGKAPELPEDAFIYLDPPYYVKGQGLYENAYEYEDHVEIAGLVNDLKQHWLVTYDAASAIMDLYGEEEGFTYGLSYSASERYRGSEVMYFSPSISKPDVDAPASIGNAVVDKVRVELYV